MHKVAIQGPLLSIMLHAPLLLFGLHRSEASIVQRRVKHNGQYWVFNIYVSVCIFTHLKQSFISINYLINSPSQKAFPRRVTVSSGIAGIIVG